MNTKTQEVLSRLGKHDKHGHYWYACCPLHNDKEPSMRVDEGEYKVLLSCHKCGNSAEDKSLEEEYCRALGIETLSYANQCSKEVISTYIYRDEQGKELYRFEKYPNSPDGKKNMKKIPAGKGRTILYNLDKLVKLKEGDTVYLPEGEKDCDTLTAWGLIATTNPFGGGSWNNSYVKYFKGLNVVILQDMDKAGEERTGKIIKSIESIGKSIKVVKLPEVEITEKHGKDITDWKEKYGGTKEKLVEIVKKTKTVEEEKHIQVKQEYITKGQNGNRGVPPMVQAIEEPEEIEAVPFPTKLSSAAYHGILGEIVNAVEPYTEASHEALLFSLIPYVSNFISASPHMDINGKAEYPIYNIALVAPTGVGKGSAKSKIMEVLKLVSIPDLNGSGNVFADWLYNNVQTNINSGEGLIKLIKDDISTWNDKEQKFDIEKGVEDKRLLLSMNEMSQLFETKKRDGNTLGHALIQCYDCDPISAMSVNTPYKCRSPRVSIYGQIQPAVLRRSITEFDRDSGFANRATYACIRSTKCIVDPKGTQTPKDILERLSNKLSTILSYARNIGEVELSKEALEMWKPLSPMLKEVQGTNDLLSRARIQVLRYAMLYAILDEESHYTSLESDSIGRNDICYIRPEHLKAALEIWRYNVDSINHVFGISKHGVLNRDEEKIYKSLKENGEMTQTEISLKVFNNNAKGDRIPIALQNLSARGLIEDRKEPAGKTFKKVWKTVA